ncbi:Holliday junction resolvase RuvX [Thiotrichales bacterium 19S11-10]|nr:Holliday junction resolvase RuvX [Thiotrichales bacterium 19S11-10]MCF6807401.1 Holliday junction resolvase RuvX [Thiotrichales bacterium 19S9-11]MCF6811370.1 Holliday junction resolvase RuvX [Thiotrichales bacterium 19S9-12]
MTNKRLLGFDFGLKRIGIATGQLITKTASPLDTVESSNDNRPNWQKIDQIIKKWRPTDLVVGLPIDTFGKETDITIKAREFANDLSSRYNKPTHLIEEAYSTRQARWQLEETKGKTVNHLKVDSLAACIILETWMNEQS